EGTIKQLAGRPDERPATQVLVVARLLTDEHDPRVSLAFAEDGLGRALIEVTARAAGGGLTQSLERGPDRRNERRGGRMWLARRHARLYARRRANGAERQCAGASARAAGIRMRNDAPRPPRFSAVISPPRSRMIPAEMERPSPVPVRPVVYNGSKTTGSVCGRVGGRGALTSPIAEGAGGRLGAWLACVRQRWRPIAW